MSLNKIIDIDCPKCKKNQKFKVWQSINVTEDIELKNKVFDRSIFMFKCDSCNSEIVIEYPFIYHDYSKKFFVYFNPSGKFDNVTSIEGYKIKKASDYMDFLEQIHILEDDADETKILELKKELLNKFKLNDKLKNINKIYYSGLEKGEFTFFVPEINGRITV